jgi:hypothetical protein
MKKKQIKTEKSLLEKAFAEIMPEVKFIDVTPTDKKSISGNKSNMKIIKK